MWGQCYGSEWLDNYELYHDLHGPDGCEVYCVSRSDVDVVPYCSGDEEGDVYEGDVALPQTGSDEMVDMLEHSVISTIGPGGPCDETGSVADAPGDAIVVSSECRDIDRGTLDSIQMCRVDPGRSQVCCGPSRSIIFDEGFFAVDVCPLGMMCKLDFHGLRPTTNGAAGSRQHMGILLGTGRNSFDTVSEGRRLFPAGICTGYVSGFCAGNYP